MAFKVLPLSSVETACLVAKVGTGVHEFQIPALDGTAVTVQLSKAGKSFITRNPSKVPQDVIKKFFKVFLNAPKPRPAPVLVIDEPTRPEVILKRFCGFLNATAMTGEQFKGSRQVTGGNNAGKTDAMRVLAGRSKMRRKHFIS